MREEHRLGVLHMGHSRRRRLLGEVAFCLVHQRGLQLSEPRGDLSRVIAQVHPQVGRDLIVPAPASAQPAAQRPDALEQAPFQRGVHVLVGRGGPEGAGLAVPAELIDRGEQPGDLLVVEQPSPVQHARVRAGREQVIAREPPVELNADRQPRQRVGGP